ncbi:hypothetical protein GCM10010387_04370 [Streptomyces inusitatus]|uniref:Uncharacterized protein n=1 Tax=Streptomyces inusitatus TaxID=68221 RepID=A0A918PLF4_9ACTN|nr:hypothetical protein [Streptomyces inusitatus]GGZ15203.1 hypothetical protein GCM10010387_04370 [Streptomyces inusitatus]
MPGRTKEEKATARERVIVDRDTVITRYTQGDSLRAIARTYDVHAPWLAARLTRWGVHVRPHNTPPTSHSHVLRDNETGAVTALRCPDPHCGRLTHITRNRLAPHTTTTTGTGCPLSNAPVQDQAHTRTSG